MISELSADMQNFQSWKDLFSSSNNIYWVEYIIKYAVP